MKFLHLDFHGKSSLSGNHAYIQMQLFGSALENAEAYLRPFPPSMMGHFL